MVKALDHPAEPVGEPGSSDGSNICRHCGRRIFAAWTYVGDRPWSPDDRRSLGEPDLRWRHAPTKTGQLPGATHDG